MADYEKISQVAAERVQAMQALLAPKPAAPDQEIPVLPVYNAAQVFRAQVQYVNMQNGAGVRFVTMYSQGLMPATNKDVFYTYQGLTSDGAYWVSAILPVNAAFLPADTNAAAIHRGRHRLPRHADRDERLLPGRDQQAERDSCRPVHAQPGGAGCHDAVAARHRALNNNE